MSRQARQRRRRHNRERRHALRPDRAAASPSTALIVAHDRGGRLRAERRRLGDAAGPPAPDRQRRLLAGVRRRRHPPRLHPVRRAAHARSAGTRSPRSSRTPRSRSRTSASTKTTASTSPASSARRSRTSRNGAPLQGASTITMQLMRNVYLGGDKHTLKQKIIEAKLAIDYEKRHSKRSILTELPQQRPLRHRRRADGDRRAGGRADLLRQTRLAAEPAAVGAARRPAAGALAVQPVPQPAGRAAAAQRGAGEDGANCTTSRARAGRQPSTRRWKSSTATSTRSARRTSSSNTCAAAR